MLGTIGKPTCQGRRLRKWKIYDKSSQIEKGKCPKAMTKVVIIKEGKSENLSQGKAGKAEKVVTDKSSNYGPKEGAVSKFDE